MRKLFYLLLVIIFTGGFTVSYGAIKITPTILELNTTGIKGNYLTTSFSVQGGDTETIRFKVYPEYFKISQEGTMNVLENTDAKDSLIKNTRFVPNEFTLQNGNIQKVRLTITDVNSLPDGESRMVLFLEDVAAKELFLPSGNKNVQTKLIVRTRVGIPVYVDKGHFVKCARLENFDIQQTEKDINLALKILSEGNSKVRCSGKAQIIKDKKLIAEYPVKNNVAGAKSFLIANQQIPLDKITENGDYTLRLIINYNDEKGRLKSLIKENKFTLDNKQSI